jgi:hypothetical protein
MREIHLNFFIGGLPEEGPILLRLLLPHIFLGQCHGVRNLLLIQHLLHLLLVHSVVEKTHLIFSFDSSSATKEMYDTFPAPGK